MAVSNINGYNLSKQWWDHAFTNSEVKPVHSCLYFFYIDLWNRLAQPTEFAIPTNETMRAVGICNFKTYSKAVQQLIDWGFIKLVHKSTNQYTASKIALVKNTKALPKALPKAIHEAITEALPEPATQGIAQSNTQGIVDIIKPINLLTIEPITNVNKIRVGVDFFDLSPWDYYKKYCGIHYESTLQKLDKKITEDELAKHFNSEKLGIDFSNDNHVKNAVTELLKRIITPHYGTQNNSRTTKGPATIGTGSVKTYNDGHTLGT